MLINVVMAAATVLMAVFSGLTWYLSREIKRDAARRADELDETILSMVIVISAAGAAAGEPDAAARLYEQHETALRERLNKPKKPLPA